MSTRTLPRTGRPTHPTRTARALVGGAAAALVLLLALAGCEREDRRFRDIPPVGASMPLVTQSALQPGLPTPDRSVGSGVDDNAWALSEGNRLFNQYNCVGCHAHGGGGMGPPLMDATWIYGSQPENIAQTIIEGRPNGMPSFRGRINDTQVWEIVAYVRSLSGLAPRGAEPGREDHMMTRVPPQSTPPAQPKPAVLPPGARP